MPVVAPSSNEETGRVSRLVILLEISIPDIKSLKGSMLILRHTDKSYQETGIISSSALDV